MNDQERQEESQAPAKAKGMPESVTCPFCASRDVELVSLFGGQLSTDQYYCRACRTYFERFGRDDDEPTA
jgi:transcription elongation factor Elf1